MIKMLKLCKRNIEIGSKKILKRWNRNVEQWPSCRNRPVSFETRLGRFVLGPDQMPDSLSCWAFLSLSKKKKKKKKGSSSSPQAARRLEPDSQERHRPPARRFHLHWGLRPASPRLRSQAGKASAGRLPNPTRGPCRPLDLVERLARPCSCSEPRLGGEWCFSLPPPCICWRSLALASCGDLTRLAILDLQLLLVRSVGNTIVHLRVWISIDPYCRGTGGTGSSSLVGL